MARLDEALRNLTHREGDARGEIYAYLRGEQKVGPQRAFFIGEALRECGIAWSSGPIALAAAGHFVDLVALLVLLIADGEGEETRAAILAAACAVMTCYDSGDAELAALQNVTRERLAASSIASGDCVRETWEALAQKAHRYGRLFYFASPWLRDAYVSARVIDEESRGRRVFEDLGRWALAFAKGDARLTSILAPYFVCRARIDQSARESYYQAALRETARDLFGAQAFDELLEAAESDIPTYLRKPTKRS